MLRLRRKLLFECFASELGRWMALGIQEEKACQSDDTLWLSSF